MFTKEDFIKKYQNKPVIEYQNNVDLEPQVSVLVTAYQHVNFIKSCLDSILIQDTNFSFEIIVGEDESSDGTREICINYAKKYPTKIRLFLHSRENNILMHDNPTGYFNSMYNHLSARGKYLAYCEADDFWTNSNKLQRQVDFLEENQKFSGCAHLSDVLFDKTKVKNENRFKHRPDKIIFKTNDLLEYTPFHTSSIVFRRELLDLNLMNRSGLLELHRDHPIMIMLSSYGPIMRFPEIMSVYRRNLQGLSENINYATKKNAYIDNIITVNALSRYIKGFFFKSLYMKGHWHRTMLEDENTPLYKKGYHFFYFFLTSFYKFPKNIKKIMGTIKNIIFK